MHDADPMQRRYLSVDGELYVSLAETQRRLKLSRQTTYRWRKKGKLPSLTHEGRIYCPETRVIRLEIEQEAGHVGS